MADDYGFLKAMASISPELAAIVAEADASGGMMTPALFQQRVQASNWYKTTLPALRQYQTMAASDPQGLEQKIQQTMANINKLGQVNGIFLNPASNGGYDAHLLAVHAVKFGLTDVQLDQTLRALGGPGGPDQVFSQNQQTYAQLKQMAQAYGQSYSDTQYMDWVGQIMRQNGNVDINHMNNWFKRVAISSFPGLKDQIDAGMTVQDIAQPYIQSMAQTLEVPQTEINVLDPTIRKALTTFSPNDLSGPKQQTAMPLWQFEQQLKNDPRWDKTKNAAQTAYETAAQVGRDFGFIK